MIAGLPQPPSAGDRALAVVALFVAAFIAAVAAHLAWRTRNWLFHVGTVGGLLVVAGVVGQRTPVPGQAIGPWDAGITLPVINVSITPVAAAGLILALVAVTLVLLFERVPDPDQPAHRPVARRLEDDDTV